MHINIKFMGYLYKIVFLAKTHAYYSEKYFKMKSKKKFNLRDDPENTGIPSHGLWLLNSA